MVSTQTESDAPASERSFTADMNFLARSCSAPKVNNGDYSQNIFPLETMRVTMWDGETLASPPRLEREGFCRTTHKVNLDGLGEDPSVIPTYNATLSHLLKELTGADEVVVMPVAMIRNQSDTKVTQERVRGVPANFAHSDSTRQGGYELEEHFFEPPGRPNPRRIAQFNIWRLLSPAPANMPLALCDARSVQPDDIVAGPAYFPSKDISVDTAFFHANDHFRWVYFSKLTSEQVLVFKQFDTDPGQPQRVPHAAFLDPTAQNAHSRISVESRCSARWYD
ncbi:MAG: CmcJ/NvfI family oxidoreductase [Sphingobium sp.]|nr:hypothetical protein [Sphingobium sp.]MCP5400066.1 hypothetical protein [Sphingomonas sp.]